MRSILGAAVFLVVVLVISFLAHLYLYRSFVRGRPSRSVRRAAAAGLALLGALLVASPVAQRLDPSALTLAIAKAGYVWMGLAFYLVVSFGTLDLVRLASRLLHRKPPPADSSADTAPSPSRRRFLVQSAGVGAAAIALPTSAYGVWRAHGPCEVTETAIPLPNLPRTLSGFTLVQLTDIHAGVWVDRRFVEQLVEQANALRPDLFVITGDLVDGSVERLAPVVEPLTGLKSRFGTWFVTGNHEYYSGDVAWVQALRRMGMGVLRNERASIGDAGGTFDLVGVDDWGAARQGFGRGYDLDAALAGRDPERACVLLAHQPGGFDQAAARGVGLQLSGHTHGGQIWPWTVLVSVAYQSRVAGHYRSGDGHLYISRGCGFWGPPFRVGAPPELAHIALV